MNTNDYIYNQDSDIYAGIRSTETRETRAYVARTAARSRTKSMLRHWYKYDPGSLEKAILRELADVVPVPVRDHLVPGVRADAEYCLLSRAVIADRVAVDHEYITIMEWDDAEHDYVGTEYSTPTFLFHVIRAFDDGGFPDWEEHK